MDNKKGFKYIGFTNEQIEERRLEDIQRLHTALREKVIFIDDQQALIDELVEGLREVEEGLEEAVPTIHSLTMRININRLIIKATNR